MSAPSYITSEDIYGVNSPVLCAVLMTTPTRLVVDYETMGPIDQARLDQLVQANGGTLPLTDFSVARNLVLDNGKTWFETYEFSLHESIPSSGGGSGSGTGTGGSSITGNGVFILDITPTASGIVGVKTYKTSAPASTVIATATSDTNNVTVTVGASGSSTKYSPVVTVNGSPVTLSETPTKRWFTGSIPLVASGSPFTVTATDGEGCTDTATLTLAGAGPVIASVVVGAFPGTQTALKSGDAVNVTVVADATATQIHVKSIGAVFGATALQRVGVTNTFTGTVIVSGLSGAQTVTAYATNALGTAGADVSSLPVLLDQTVPVISNTSVTYPATQTALQTGQTATVNATVVGYTSVSYSGSGLTIPAPNTYNSSKTVSHSVTGYQTVQYNITATYDPTGATSQTSIPVVIATVAPTASISISGNPARLVSSPTGISYTVVVTPNQANSTVTAMSASAGSWAGSWSNGSSTSTRSLLIADSVARGTGTFTGLSITGPSGLVGTTITAGNNYTVGGFTMRTVTFPAFSRVAPIGTSVAIATKTSAQYTGGSVLTLHTDNSVAVKGYYPANSDGTYNATGSYIGLSDTSFAGSNTSGTLQVDIQEVA